MFSKALLVLAAVSPAFATVFITSPVGASTWPAGQQQTISWKDDGASPSLAQFGPSKVGVYVGNAQQQTQVQAIVASVDVSTTSSIVFTPDASVGENGNYYFIRVESLALKDTTNPAFPALAFSSKYTMSGMTGTFSADVKAQIASSGSSLGSSNAGTTGAGTASTPTTGTTKAAAATSKSATASSNSASGTAGSAGAAGNGAASVPVSAFACAAGIAVAVFSAMFA